jgi:hypothetical protein
MSNFISWKSCAVLLTYKEYGTDVGRLSRGQQHAAFLSLKLFLFLSSEVYDAPLC